MGRRARPGCMRGDRGRALRVKLAARDGARCFWCRRPFAAPAVEATFDHFVPYSVWRTNAQPNLVLSCKRCNSARANALPWPLVWLLLAPGQQYVPAA